MGWLYRYKGAGEGREEAGAASFYLIFSVFPGSVSAHHLQYGWSYSLVGRTWQDGSHAGKLCGLIGAQGAGLQPPCAALLPGLWEGRPNALPGHFGNVEKCLSWVEDPGGCSPRALWHCEEAGGPAQPTPMRDGLTACCPSPLSLAPPENTIFLGEGENLEGVGPAGGCCCCGNSPEFQEGRGPGWASGLQAPMEQGRHWSPWQQCLWCSFPQGTA